MSKGDPEKITDLITGKTLSERVEQIITLQVPAGYTESLRIDRYLARFLPNVSRTKVGKGIEEGLVAVNGATISKPSHIVQAGDTIVCTILRPPPIEAQPEPIALDIVYEDDAVIVVDKPAGMVVHPAYGHRTGTLVNALLHHVGAGPIGVDAGLEGEEFPNDDMQGVGLSVLHALPDRDDDPAIRPGIVHRLDKDTSGLVVVAKDDASHRHLARQFAEHTIVRRYLAVLWGLPYPVGGRIEGDIGRDPRDRKRMTVVPSGTGKHAVTHYETLEHLDHTVLASFHLETGRTHQIRVHAQHMGHPVFGDETYGGRALRFGPVSASRKAFAHNLFTRLDRQALHAETLAFIHPRTGQEVSFRADLPEDMRYVIERLRRAGGADPAPDP